MPDTKTYTIELDCPPGAPRPDQLLPSVLEGTGIEPDDLENTGRFFGNWTYEVPEHLSAKYRRARRKVERRIKQLHKKGRIRYGSW